MAYISATTGAVVTALGFKTLASVMPVVEVNQQIKYIKVTHITDICAGISCLNVFLFLPLQRLPPIASRFVPFAAVAAANCINIPFMRQR